jgi:hypothetical protein
MAHRRIPLAVGLVGAAVSCGHATAPAPSAAPTAASSVAATAAPPPRATATVAEHEAPADDFVPLEPGWPGELDEAPPSLRTNAEALPIGAIARLGSKAFALFQPKVTDYQLAFSGDGRLFLTGDRFMKRQLGGAASPVPFESSGHFSMSRDHTRVVHGCNEGSEIEDASTGRTVARLAVPKPKATPATSGGAVAVGWLYAVCAAFSPDGRSVVMMSARGEDPAIYDRPHGCQAQGARPRGLHGSAYRLVRQVHRLRRRFGPRPVRR